MEENQSNRNYVDAILSLNMTLEEREEDLRKLKEASDKLKEWPKM